MAQSAYWTLSANLGGKSAGTVSGFMNMGAQIGGVVTASTTAIIASAFGWTTSFLAAAAICLFGGLLWFLVDPDHVLRGSDRPTADNSVGAGSHAELSAS